MFIHSGSRTDVRLLVFDNDDDDDKEAHTLIVDQVHWLVAVVISKIISAVYVLHSYDNCLSHVADDVY